MDSAGPSSNDSFYKLVLQSSFGKSKEQRGIVPGASVSLFTLDSSTGLPEHVGIARISVGSTTNEFRTELHGHKVEDNVVIIESAVIFGPYKNRPYPYTFKSTDDVPSSLQQFISSAYYVWDHQAMRAFSKRQDITTPSNTMGSASGSTKDFDDGLEIIEINDDSDVDENLSHNSDILNDSVGTTFIQRRLLLSDYVTTRVSARINQIHDFSHPLRQLDELHRDELQNRFLDPNVGYQEAAGLMSVTVQDQDMQLNVSMLDMFEKVGSSSLQALKENSTLTIVDGRHRISSIRNIMQMEGSQYNWSRQPFHFCYISRKDGKQLSSWEILMWSKNKNRDSSLVKKDTSLKSLLSSVIAYSSVFSEQYGIDFMTACNKDIALDLELSGFLGSLSNSSYKRYVRLAKLLIRYPNLRKVVLEETSFSKATASTATGITYLSDPNLLKCSEFNMILMIKCADSFISSTNSSRFYPGPFYKSCLQFIAAINSYFGKLSAVKSNHSVPETLDAFLDNPYKSTKTAYSTVRQTMENNLKAFQYNPNDFRQTSQRQIKAQITRLMKKLDDHYFPSTPVPNQKITHPTPTTQPNSKRKLSSTPSFRYTPNTATANRNNIEPDTNSQRNAKRRKRSNVAPSPPKNDQLMSAKMKNVQSTMDSVISTPKNQSMLNTKATMNKNNAKPPTKSTVTPDVQITSGTNGNFNDSFDEQFVPPGYDIQHALWQLKSRSQPSQEFRTNFRLPPQFRVNKLEEEMDNNRVEIISNGTSIEIIDTTPYCASIFLPYQHRANVFMTVPMIKYLRSLAWSWATKSELYSQNGPADPQTSLVSQWTNSLNDRNHPYASAFFSRKKTELMEAGYTILEGMADHSYVAKTTVEAFLPLPEGMSTMSLSEMFNQLMTLFPGQDHLRDERNRTDWNPIINTGDEQLDENNRDRGVARYSSTTNFLTKTLEANTTVVQLSVRRAYLDAWIGIILALMNIDNDGEWKCSFPSTGGRLILNVPLLPDQAGHNDFPYRAGHCPGFFVIVTGTEYVHLWLCKSSNNFIWYSPEDKRKMADLMVMSEITIAPRSLFIGHGYLQHAGAGWRGFAALRYHIYLIPEDLVLPDAIHFGFEWSLKRDNETTRRQTMMSQSNVAMGASDKSNQSQSSSDTESEHILIVPDAGDDEHSHEVVDDVPEV